MLPMPVLPHSVSVRKTLPARTTTTSTTKEDHAKLDSATVSLPPLLPSLRQNTIHRDTATSLRTRRNNKARRDQGADIDQTESEPLSFGVDTDMTNTKISESMDIDPEITYSIPSAHIKALISPRLQSTTELKDSIFPKIASPRARLGLQTSWPIGGHNKMSSHVWTIRSNRKRLIPSVDFWRRVPVVPVARTVTDIHGFLSQQDIEELSRKTKLNRRDLYKSFVRYKALCQLSSSPDGVDIDLLRTCLPALLLEEEDFITWFFHAFEVDNLSKQLSFEKFLVANKCLQNGAEELKARYQEFINGHKEITKDQLLDIFYSSLKSENEFVRREDASQFLDEILGPHGLGEKFLVGHRRSITPSVHTATADSASVGGGAFARSGSLRSPPLSPTTTVTISSVTTASHVAILSPTYSTSSVNLSPTDSERVFVFPST